MLVRNNYAGNYLWQPRHTSKDLILSIDKNDIFCDFKSTSLTVNRPRVATVTTPKNTDEDLD